MSDLALHKENIGVASSCRSQRAVLAVRASGNEHPQKQRPLLHFLLTMTTVKAEYLCLKQLRAPCHAQEATAITELIFNFLFFLRQL